MSGPDELDPTAATADGEHDHDSDSDAFVRRVLAAPRSSQPVVLLPDTIVDDTYRVIRRLGAGGMGVVYLAHDRQLKRDVALKLHGATTGARLAREATAIAQFVHPNVVTVHQIGRHDGQTYVAMEYLDGGTARTWLDEGGRSWREIVELYLGAARGLAAAHQAGMVHRDFKPENLLVGRDGRVRVADFGLARDVGERDVALLDSGDRLSALTETGAVMGTPAYMAPEQHDGGAVGAAADQFAFCASLWGALYGERPFSGHNPAELAAAAKAGTIQAPADDRGVPRRIRLALERGLGADPAKRHPSMAALADALAPRRSRARVVAIGGVALLAAAGAAYALWPTTADDRCGPTVAIVDRELPESLIDGLRAAIVAKHGTTPIGARLGERLGRVRPKFHAAAVAVCRDRALSAELVTRGRACLTTRARATAIFLDDRALIDTRPNAYAVRLMAIPPLAPCADPVVLSATPTRVDDAAILARALLWVAATEVGGGRVAAAQVLLERARQAAAADDAGARALALIVEGRLAYQAERFDDASRQLADAFYAGQALDDTAVYLAALTALLLLHTGERFDAEVAAPWIRTAEAAVQKDRARAPAEIADLLSALVAVADRAGDGAAALRHADAMRDVLESLEDNDRLASAEITRGHALAAAGQLAEAAASYRRALTTYEASLGPSHPRTALVLASLGLVLLDSAQHDQAVAVAAKLDAALAAMPPESTITRATSLHNLALLLSDAGGDLDRAAHAYREARAIYVALEGDDHPDVLLCDAGLAVVANKQNRPREAMAILERVLAAQERTLGADHPEVGSTQYNLAAAALLAEDFVRGEVAARRAEAIFGADRPGTRHHAFTLMFRSRALVGLGRGREAMPLATRAEALAKTLSDDPETSINASVEIARVAIALGRDLPDARARLVAARAGFAAMDSPSPIRLADVDRLLAKLDR